MKNRRFNILLLLMLSVAALYLYSCKEESRSVKPVVIEFKKEAELFLKTVNDSLIAQIDIEIADDEYQTQTGLMYRTSMEKNQGMLFVFPEEEPRSFYMKNTLIPLDIIYIDAKKEIVSFQKNAKPNDETSLPSNVPTQYVLEVNAGLSDQWDLQVGDRIEYKILN